MIEGSSSGQENANNLDFFGVDGSRASIPGHVERSDAAEED
jgi:hypothetical protein